MTAKGTRQVPARLGIILTLALTVPAFVIAKRHIFFVEGHSMEPTLPPGSVGFFTPASQRATVGDVVLLIDPWPGVRGALKRVVALNGDCNKVQADPVLAPMCNDLSESDILVAGDSPLFSVDSRLLGPIPKSSVRGVAVVRLWPFAPRGL